MDHPDILEQLRIQTGCDYVSELRDAPYGKNLLKDLARFELEQYPLSAWTDVIHYLTQEPAEFQSYEKVAQLIACSQ